MEHLASYAWIAMAIGAQFMWAWGNFLDKFLLKRYHLTTNQSGPGTIVFMSCFTAAIAALGIAFAAAAAPQFGYKGPTKLEVEPLQALKGMFVGVVQLSWTVAYLYALDQSDEAESVPLFQSVPIFALLIGIYLNDIPPLVHIAGSVIIIVGVLILNLHLGTMRLNHRVILLMLLASFLVALAAFLFKQNAQDTNFFSSVFWMKLGLVATGITVGVLTPSYRQQLDQVVAKKDWAGLSINLLNELFDRLARMIFFGAILIGPSVMSVQATAAYQPIFILVIGLFLAKNGSSYHANRYKSEELVKKIVGVALVGLGSSFLFLF